jgi:hypothetical protein
VILLVLANQAGVAARGVWRAHELITTAYDAQSVFAADMDGDGDLDVLSSSSFDRTFRWFENNGHAHNPAFAVHTLAIGSGGAFSVSPADVDGDGDMDAFAASGIEIAWQENDGGSTPSFSSHTISATGMFYASVFAADVDGDGNVDVLSASMFDDKIAWFENDGALPSGFTEHVITQDPDGFSGPLQGFADGAYRVFAADIDGDGDMDVLSAAPSIDQVAWYENDGGSPPSFTVREITTPTIRAAGVADVVASDLDGDGDLDVLAAPTTYGEPLSWFENDGTRPPAFIRHLISSTSDTFFSVFASDVDGDGDTDVLTASSYLNRVTWYENDGGQPPSFTERTITSDARCGRSVHAADLDGDGDNDVMSASLCDDTIAWYENRMYLKPQ